MTISMDTIRRMRLTEPDHYHGMVKMHLSFLLDLHTDECDCSFLEDARTEVEIKDTVDAKLKKVFTPMRKSKPLGVMDGVPLTQEGVCQVYQIIEYLGRPHNIISEGLFRKHGNLKKQQALKERLNKGIALNLDDEEFTVHEAAAVLKMFLSNLPEPLLTDAYYEAHCQVPNLVKERMNSEEKYSAEEKQISCLQLLFQLIPAVNLALLKDLLLFLNAVSCKEKENKMNSTNLGTLFSNHILCPRKISPEGMKANHQLHSRAVTFMIDHAEHLFDLPQKLKMDVLSYQAKVVKGTCDVVKEKNGKEVKCKQSTSGDLQESPVVSTIFSFVDREASLAATHGNETDHALAKLYAHVQGMPESAQKRRLVSKLNEANGKGTPDVATSGRVRVVGKAAVRQRRKSGEGILNLLTPRRKRAGNHGSYSVKAAQGEIKRNCVEPSHSFRRQDSSQPSTPVSSRAFSPGESLLSPRDRLPSPSTGGSTASSVSPPVDEVDTPGKDSSLVSPHCSSGNSEIDSYDEQETGLDGSYTGSCSSLPPLPPRTPAPGCSSFLSPGAPQSIYSPEVPQSLSPRVRITITTPRSREGLLVCSNSQLEKWNVLLSSSRKESGSSLEEEPSGSDSDSQPRGGSISDHSNEVLENNGDGGDDCFEDILDKDLQSYSHSFESCRQRGYRSQTLSNQFRQYLEEQGLQILDDSMVSVVEEGENSNIAFETSYSEQVKRLLNDGDKLSDSLQAFLDGGDSKNTSNLCDSNYPHNDGINNENSDPQLNSPSSDIKPRRGVKRRSLTEIPKASVKGQGSIFFETDL